MASDVSLASNEEPIDFQDVFLISLGSFGIGEADSSYGEAAIVSGIGLELAVSNFGNAFYQNQKGNPIVRHC